MDFKIYIFEFAFLDFKLAVLIVEGVCNIPSMYAAKITGPEERGEEKEESFNCSKAQKREI